MVICKLMKKWSLSFVSGVNSGWMNSPLELTESSWRCFEDMEVTLYQNTRWGWTICYRSLQPLIWFFLLYTFNVCCFYWLKFKNCISIVLGVYVDHLFGWIDLWLTWLSVKYMFSLSGDVWWRGIWWCWCVLALLVSPRASILLQKAREFLRLLKQAMMIALLFFQMVDVICLRRHLNFLKSVGNFFILYRV